MPNRAPSIEGLSLTEKRILLAKLLQEKARQGTVFPLSHGQRGLWFLYQMDPASAACNIAFPSRIRSRLDVPAFQRSLQALVDRHASLRTTFAECDGELLQTVHPTMPVSFEVLDATAWTEQDLDAQLDATIHRPFDLEQGPLLRTHLFTRAADDHIFVAVAHHIVMDFWSLIVLLRDVRNLYPAECGTRAETLPPTGRGYAEFVRWQGNLLSGPQGARLRSFWGQALAGVPQVLELPVDRPRPPVFTHRAGVVPFHLSPELTNQLTALASDTQVTLYAALLAAFQALLSRYSGQRDFLVGGPFSGRSRPGFEQTVGYFVNMLPLRADLNGDPTFRQLLERVGATVLAALEHQDYPFPLIVDHLRVKQDPSRPPLVQVSFTLEKAHQQEEAGRGQFLFPDTKAHRNVGGLLGETHYVEQRTCQHEIELVLEQSGGAIYGMLRYCRDLFDTATGQRMAHHFQTLLAHAVASPERRLAELPWFTEAERHQVVEQWNQTQVDFPTAGGLSQLFERQVQRTPDAVALSCGDRLYRYAELDAWANALADQLCQLDVRPGNLVALCLERSPATVAAMLGTLKAGAVYVPLDPRSPAARLRSVLADTQARVCFTQGNLRPPVPRGSTQLVCLDPQPADSSAPQDHQPPPHRAQGDDPAYVIYTSGSTGQPKGVVVEHRAICNTIRWRHRALPVEPGDRVLLILPHFFDASVCVIFSTLTQGGHLVLAEPSEELNPAAVVERLADERITVLPTTPRLLQLLLDHPQMSACRSLRQVHCGGEVMPATLPRQLAECLPASLYNLYGPTEVAVEATCWPCRPDDHHATIPIGRPLANVQTYVLDPDRRPLPIGVPGELYIGGAGLARGYLNDAQRTADRFVPHPFSNAPGARLYRTGDRCRWLQDGSLEFLGRLDQQVKIRGRRIELGEIEHALVDHDAVREAAVTVWADRSGESRLVAYLVADADRDPPDAATLRHYLADRLPAYMVPDLFACLPRLPRTTTGKLDRHGLPVPRFERTATDHHRVAPRTPLEQFLAGIWCDTLHIDQVGVLDTFYELGGNSIQAALLAARLQDRLGQRLETRALFELSDIASLAGYLATAYPDTIAEQFGPQSLPPPTGPTSSSRAPSEPPAASALGSTGTSSPADLLVALQPHGDRPPLFLVHPPGGIVVCYQPLAHHLGRAQPLYGIRARGLHGEQNLPHRLEEMAAEYTAAVRSVQPAGPYTLGGWSLGGVVALEMAQQLQAQDQPVALLAFFDTTIPFGPANRAYGQAADNSGLEYGLEITLDQLGALGPEEQLPYLWQHARRLGLIDPGAPESIVQQVLADLQGLFHAHVQLASQYVLRPYRGHIHLFRPEDAPVAVATPPDRGWGRLADRVTVHVVPGQHHTMVKEPHVAVLAQRLRACLWADAAGPSR